MMTANYLFDQCILLAKAHANLGRWHDAYQLCLTAMNVANRAMTVSLANGQINGLDHFMLLWSWANECANVSFYQLQLRKQ